MSLDSIFRIFKVFQLYGYGNFQETHIYSLNSHLCRLNPHANRGSILPVIIILKALITITGFMR